MTTACRMYKMIDGGLLLLARRIKTSDDQTRAETDEMSLSAQEIYLLLSGGDNINTLDNKSPNVRSGWYASIDGHIILIIRFFSFFVCPDLWQVNRDAPYESNIASDCHFSQPYVLKLSLSLNTSHENRNESDDSLVFELILALLNISRRRESRNIEHNSAQWEWLFDFRLKSWISQWRSTLEAKSEARVLQIDDYLSSNGVNRSEVGWRGRIIMMRNNDQHRSGVAGRWLGGSSVAEPSTVSGGDCLFAAVRDGDRGVHRRGRREPMSDGRTMPARKNQSKRWNRAHFWRLRAQRQRRNQL